MFSVSKAEHASSTGVFEEEEEEGGATAVEFPQVLYYALYYVLANVSSMLELGNVYTNPVHCISG